MSRIFVRPDEVGLRLDKLLALRFPRQSRSYMQALIEKGLILLNGKPAKKRVKPAEGDEIEAQFVVTPEISLEPENIPLDILYEDEWILAINKPAGLVVHPGVGNWSGTFVNALLYYCEQLPPSKEPLRPGIVHRLDKETTGVLLAAKREEAHKALVDQFALREVHKEYLAICVGNPGSETIDEPIGRHPKDRRKYVVTDGGKHAVTHVRTLACDGKLSVVRCILETGRTHQIRVHLQHRRSPILGDSTYGVSSWNEKYKTERQLLHAERVSLPHPITGEPLEIVAPLPQDIATFMEKIS